MQGFRSDAKENVKIHKLNCPKAENMIISHLTHNILSRESVDDLRG